MTPATAPPPATLLELDDLRVRIRTPAGYVHAVDGISLEVRHGEILGVVGESGSGKSVTALSILRLLDARDQHTTGSIRFEGEDVLAMGEASLRRLRGGRIAIVLQDPMASLNPVLTVGDQLVEGIRCHSDASGDAARTHAIHLLRGMGLTTPDRAVDRYPHQFSGGMRQRIMLAMGFGNSPALLIADEPTTALDVTIQAQILDLLRTLNAEFGTAIMLITHDLGVVASLCSRIAVMYAGKIVEEGPAEQILADPRHPYTRALIDAVPRIDRAVARGRPLKMLGGAAPSALLRPVGCRFRERCPRQVARCAEEPPSREVAPGHRVACWLVDQPASSPDADPAPVAAVVSPPGAEAGALLTLAGLTKHYPVRRRWLWEARRVVHALDDVSLEVRRGETLGLVGESGSGKSTLARLVVRLHRPTAGTIRFDGEEIGEATPRRLRRLRRHLQMVFQDPYSSLNQRLTVGSAIAEPLLLHKLVATRREAAERIADLLADVGLGRDAASRYPHEFSGGQRQRIGIARALAAGPKLIVADEPISSLDVNVQAQILNLLLRLQGEHGLTYVFISHNLAVVRQIAHRIAVLYLGQVVEIAETDMIFDRPLHPYTRSLISAVPIPDVAIERARPHRRLPGEAPSIIDPPSGCRFRTRCPIAQAICAEAAPPLLPHGAGQAACHFPGQA
jgi:peptide/nickel transport system ATP-binding protein